MAGLRQGNGRPADSSPSLHPLPLRFSASALVSCFKELFLDAADHRSERFGPPPRTPTMTRGLSPPLPVVLASSLGRRRTMNTMTAEPSDPELTARLARRDEAALGVLYDRHQGAVYALLLRLLDEGGAQEVLQDVFLRLWERPGHYDPARGELRAFLLVMARSRALDRLRRNRGEWRLYDEAGEDFPLPDPGQNPFAQAAEAERREAVGQAMNTLSAAHRETVRRAFLLGESREETAQAMGVPVGTVKSRLNAALAQLRRTLGGEREALIWEE